MAEPDTIRHHAGGELAAGWRAGPAPLAPPARCDGATPCHHAVLAAQLEAQLAEARLDALLAQLRPHFLFNALNSLAMLVRRGATDEALQGVIDLGALLRQVLASRHAPTVPLAVELETVDRYLGVEQLRFRGSIRVRRHVDPATLDAPVPAMLLQPLVENAVRHGLRGRSDGEIAIAARREGGLLVVEVRDDGPGFAHEWTLADCRGLGLANTVGRLCRLYGDGHRFEVRTAPEGGAVVTVGVPFGVAPAPVRWAPV